MSAEVLIEERYYPLEDDPDDAAVTSYIALPAATSGTDASSSGILFSPSGGVKHQPIHDLESFFWVLCWLCIFREGPAHKRENWGDNDQERQAARENAINVFELTELTKIATMKRRLILQHVNFMTMLSQIFTPFCSPLRYEVGLLYQALRRTYKHSRDAMEKAYPVDTLYDQFLEILDGAQTRPEILNHDTSDPVYLPQEAAETHRREHQLEIWATPLPDKKRRHPEDDGKAAYTSAYRTLDAPDGSPARKTRRSNHQSGKAHVSKGKGKVPVPSTSSGQTATAGPSNVPKTPPRKSGRSARTESDKDKSSPISSPGRPAGKRTPTKKRK